MTESTRITMALASAAAGLTVAAPGGGGAVGSEGGCTQTRLRENVLLQAKVCQSGNGGPALNVPAGAMQNSPGQ